MQRSYPTKGYPREQQASCPIPSISAYHFSTASPTKPFTLDLLETPEPPNFATMKSPTVSSRRGQREPLFPVFWPRSDSVAASHWCSHSQTVRDSQSALLLGSECKLGLTIGSEEPLPMMSARRKHTTEILLRLGTVQVYTEKYERDWYFDRRGRDSNLRLVSSIIHSSHVGRVTRVWRGLKGLAVSVEHRAASLCHAQTSKGLP